MSKRLSRRDFLRLGVLATGGSILAACTTPPAPTAAPLPTAAPPTTAAATAVPPTAVPPTVAPTAVPVASVKDRLKAIGWLPGAPDHAKGWETILPNVSTPPNAAPVVIKGGKRVEISDQGISDDTAKSPFWQTSMELFKIDWQVALTATAGDLGTKYNLAMASGELPDWMEEIPQTTYVQMLEADSLEDITDAWAATASADWLKKPMDSYLDGKAAWSYAKAKGRIKAFPMAERAANNAKLLFVRQDWLDKLGLKVPEVLDDVKAVAQAFQKAGLGSGQTTIGLNLCKSIGRGASWGGGGWFASGDGVTGAYGVMSSYWQDDGTGRLMQADIMPQMKDALAVLRDWYAAGILPTDFFTVADADAMGRSGSNLAGMHYAPAWGARWPIEDSMKNDPNAKWVWAPIPVKAAGGKRGNLGEMPYWVINGFRKGFPNVARAIECFNWWVELWEKPEDRFYGWEGINTFGGGSGFTWDGDKISGVGTAISTSPTHRPGFGPHFMRGGTYMDTYADGLLSKYIESWKDIPADKQDAMQAFLLNDPLGTQSAQRKAYVYATEHDKTDDIFDGYRGLPTPGMQSSQTSLDGMRSEAFYGIIKGDKPLSAFDDFVAQWKSAGGDQITKEVNDWLQGQ
jgi:putative aldouronate transport system substrate-binding protein